MTSVRAPELAGSGGWVGVDVPITLASLRGSVVLLHFFTASCVNCIRVAGELRQLEDEFGENLVVLGIHSPKFPYEHRHENVVDVREQLGLRHAVLDDPDLLTWQSYAVRGWPTCVLIDPHGYVVKGMTGEGVYDELQPIISSLVRELSAIGGLRAASLKPEIAPQRSRSRLAFPTAVAVSIERALIAIADTGHDRIVIAGSGGAVMSVFDGFHAPRGLCFDGEWLIVADTGADRIIRVHVDTGQRTELASDVASPWGICCVEPSSYVVSESGRHRLWTLKVSGDEVDVDVLAGTGAEGLVDGVGKTALLAQPSGVSHAGAMTWFVDAESSALRVIDERNVVRTRVGVGLFDWGSNDGERGIASFQHPVGVAASPDDGAVYIADTFNNVIREYRDGRVRTLGAHGLNGPQGIAVLPDKTLVVADTNNHRVVLIDQANGVQVELTPVFEGSIVPTPKIEKLRETPFVHSDDFKIEMPEKTLRIKAGEPMTLAWGVDLKSGEWLDDANGPPVRVTIWTDPSSRLGEGPRSWASAKSDGEIGFELLRGNVTLYVEVHASICFQEACTVRRRIRAIEIEVS